MTHLLAVLLLLVGCNTHSPAAIEPADKSPAAPATPRSTPPTSPPASVAGIGPVAEVAAGNQTTCARLRDGSVWCWGFALGPIGRVEHTRTPSPTPIPGLAQTVSVAVGLTHACAVTSAGLVRCWGNNEAGQLGDGTTTPHIEPVTVLGISDAVAVSVGASHSCARRKSGGVACWGSHQVGELGLGAPTGSSESCSSSLTGTRRSFPCRTRATDVPGVVGVVALTAGASHTCVVLHDGTARCWGHDEWGQLGDANLGFDHNSNVPVTVTGLPPAASIAAGSYHTAVLLVDGTVDVWGEASAGQLGAATSKPSPRAAPFPGLVGATQLAAGDAFTCAVVAEGAVTCWGDTRSRSKDGCPDPSTVRSCHPSPVPAPTLTGATQVSVGGRHACAVVDGGAVRCWGDNNDGELGRL